MTHAQILALPSNPSPRLIHASDTLLYYAIDSGEAGSTATVFGNATVPGSATILPAQEWVDNIASVYNYSTGGLNLANKGITHFDSNLLYNTGDLINGRLPYASIVGSDLIIDLSGNSIPTSEINAILIACKAGIDEGVVTGRYALDLSAGSNGAPSGAGITAATFLTDTALWTVATN